MPQFYSPKHWQNIKFASIYMTIMFSATWVSKDFEGTTSKKKKKKNPRQNFVPPTAYRRWSVTSFREDFTILAREGASLFVPAYLASRARNMGDLLAEMIASQKRAHQKRLIFRAREKPEENCVNLFVPLGLWGSGDEFLSRVYQSFFFCRLHFGLRKGTVCELFML